MKFISLVLITYLAYYLINILLDLLKQQKTAMSSLQAGGRMEIPIDQHVPHDHETVRVPLPDEGFGHEETPGQPEKKSL
jgi:hypothetical protein